jgi:hypothetical protein
MADPSPVRVLMVASGEGTKVVNRSLQYVFVLMRTVLGHGGSGSGGDASAVWGGVVGRTVAFLI